MVYFTLAITTGHKLYTFVITTVVYRILCKHIQYKA